VLDYIKDVPNYDKTDGKIFSKVPVLAPQPPADGYRIVGLPTVTTIVSEKIYSTIGTDSDLTGIKYTWDSNENGSSITEYLVTAYDVVNDKTIISNFNNGTLKEYTFNQNIVDNTMAIYISVQARNSIGLGPSVSSDLAILAGKPFAADYLSLTTDVSYNDYSDANDNKITVTGNWYQRIPKNTKITVLEYDLTLQETHYDYLGNLLAFQLTNGVKDDTKLKKSFKTVPNVENTPEVSAMITTQFTLDFPDTGYVLYELGVITVYSVNGNKIRSNMQIVPTTRYNKPTILNVDKTTIGNRNEVKLTVLETKIDKIVLFNIKNGNSQPIILPTVYLKDENKWVTEPIEDDKLLLTLVLNGSIGSLVALASNLDGYDYNYLSEKEGGPTGPTGPIGPTGTTGLTGPTGPTGGRVIPSGNP
jgi:hypothetical protein